MGSGPSKPSAEHSKPGKLRTGRRQTLTLCLALLCQTQAACSELNRQRELQPDHERKALPKPASTRELHAPSLLTEQPLDRALAALLAAVTAGDEKATVAALELRVLPGALELQARDPKHVDRVLLWRFAQDKVNEPIVVELRGSGKLKDNLFSLDGVYLKAIPRLSTLAIEHVDPQDGKVESIVIRRNLPFTRDVRFRVFVKSPRKNGQLDANRFGHPLLG